MDNSLYLQLVLDHKKCARHIVNSQNPNSDCCLLALAYALLGDRENAQCILDSCSDPACTDESHWVCKEAEMVLAYNMRQDSQAEELAKYILDLNPLAMFAHLTLASLACQRRNWTIALDHYRIVLDEYPNHMGILFRVAQICIYLKDFRQAQEYVSRVKPNPRSFLYRLLISFIGNPIIRLVWAILMFIVFYISPFGTLTFLLLTVLITTAWVWWGIIRRDSFIFVSLLVLQASLTLLWLVAQIVA